jgi:hypothetical protein
MAYIGAGISRFNTADELTVTGDAQIDGTTLVVDSTNNRVGIGTSSPEGLIGLPATASNTPKFRLQSASTNTDFAISSYADANGTYVSLGANYYLNSSGNDAVFETTDRSAYVLLDARNNGTVSFGTNSSGVAAERMRITSSGEVLVGKTTSGTTSTVGTDIRSNGRIQLTVDGDDGMRINRKNSDGPIQLFQKDGTTVGRIVYSSATNIALGNASKGIGIGTGSVFPTNGSTAISDAGLDLGYSSSRFKDLYLSGGAYIGGTGSSNHLDDYEEGTWTGTLKGLTSDPSSAVTATGEYTKIGRMVYVQITFSNVNTTGAAGNVFVSGTPFAPNNSNAASGTCAAYSFDFPNGRTSLSVQPGGDDLFIYVSGDSTTWDGLKHAPGTGRYLEISAQYTVA